MSKAISKEYIFAKGGTFAVMNSTKKAILLILDGWGIGKGDDSDAIACANTPFIDGLFERAPRSELKTYGENVGLPHGQMGNSEVGHMNIGAGRVVWQMLPRINAAFDDGSFRDNIQWQKLVKSARAKGTKIHLLGLVSEGGVHSSLGHLKSLCNLFFEENLDKQVKIHAFTDGRDTDPHSSESFLNEVLNNPGMGDASLATICGRYYAMDRDKRWIRTKEAYDMLVNGEGLNFDSMKSAIEASYREGISDEFIKPVILDKDACIEDGDTVLFFNFRTDRGRQLTEVLTQQHMHEFNMHTLDLEFYTMTKYKSDYNDVNVLFEDENLNMTLGETLSVKGLKQLRAAETEKYPHVTFFFNGGREVPFEGEERILVNSPKVSTYDLQPEMSAPELTQLVTKAIGENLYDFVCINYANPDMVGHTGVFEAIMKAVETVDQLAKELVSFCRELGYSVVIIADHGNADKAVNEDGTPNTAHTTNPVPCFILSEQANNVKEGKLADVAPTILDLMGIEKPEEMTGSSLIN